MKIRATKPTFQAALQSDGTLELLVYEEEIGENYWSGGGITAKTVKQQIDEAGPHTRLFCAHAQLAGRRCALGGYCHLPTCSARRGKLPITTHVDGIAASAASLS